MTESDKGRIVEIENTVLSLDSMFFKIARHGFVKQFSIIMACQEDVEVTNIEHMYLTCDEIHMLLDFSSGVFYSITLHSAIFSICWIC